MWRIEHEGTKRIERNYNEALWEEGGERGNEHGQPP